MTAVEAIGPGVHQLTDEEYFGGELARTSLSSTGVRELLATPAKFRWNQQHPRPAKRAFDVGHAAHCLILGAGPELVMVEGDGAGGPNAWTTKAVKAEVEAVRERGAVPLKPADFDAVHGMAEQLQKHPLAPRLFVRGEPEKTLVWVDEATGVLCRCKADWLRADGIVDYKSCDRADFDALTKSVYGFGYFVQDAFYRRGFRARFPGVEPFFAFTAQEKDPPYLVHVFQLSERALAYGDRKCSEALALYAKCVADDDWPGYPVDEITEIDLPAWVRTEEY